MFKNKWIALLVVLVLGALATEPALAKRGDRVKERVSMTAAEGSPLTFREARLKVERRGLSRQTLKIEINAAERGADLTVFIENATGTMERIGAMRESRPSVYKWRVRTKKGAALPFGVSDVADLSGHRVEIRTAAGDSVAAADFPTIAAAGVSADARNLRLRTGLAVEGTATDGTDDSIDARIEVRRKKDGREEWKVEVDHAPAGLLLEAWMEDSSGTPVRIGSLEEQTSDRGVEYEIERKSHEGGLPFGATDLSVLSGRKVEIRDGNGGVLASGFVPTIVAMTAAAGQSADDSASAEDGTNETDDSGSDSNDDDNRNDDNSGSDSDDDADDDNSGSGSDDDADDDNSGSDSDDDADDDNSGSGSDDDADDDNSGSGSDDDADDDNSGSDDDDSGSGS